MHFHEIFSLPENKFPGDQRSEMINSIQKILPRLEKLNGETLPKNIQFEENSQSLNLLLPAKIKLMSVDESAQGVLLNFLQQYYQVYDQTDRGPLIVSSISVSVRFLYGIYTDFMCFHEFFSIFRMLIILKQCFLCLQHILPIQHQQELTN